MLIGQKTREKFLATKSTRILFLITSICSVAPDFDYLVKLILEYLGINLDITSLFNHRGITHSIFIPLILVLIGVILTFIASKKYEQSSINSNGINLRLIGYCFIIASAFWGLHILLDLDAGEGPILLFWPFDDSTYSITLALQFFAYPFLLLPWTPVGFNISVGHYGIESLQTYLLNWSPQQIINNFGSPYFFLSFSGLILHSMIFIVYIHYVLRPIFHNAGFQVPAKFKNVTNFILHSFLLVKGYWNKIPQWLIAPALILVLIGFAFGPMIGSFATESQQAQTTVFINSNSSAPGGFISLETVDQLLEPQAIQKLQFSIYNITITNLTLGFVVAPSDIINQWVNQVNALFFTQNTTNGINILKNTTFESQYEILANSLLANSGRFYSQINITGVFSPPTINITGKQYISTGFVINSWNSSSAFSNISFISGNANFSLELIYNRDFNFLLGVFIEISGLFMLFIVVIYPFTKQRLIFFLK